MKEFFRKIGAAIKAHKARTIVISVTAFVLVCVIVALCLLNAFLFGRLSKGYVPTDEQLDAIRNNPENQYKRVVIIGVDGVGDYFSHMDTPNFDTMFNTEVNAAVTYTGTAVYPTISCENWMSMFHGVRPVYHGFIYKDTNQRVEAGEKTDSEKYPSFIKQYLDQYPDGGDVLSVCTWRGVNNGIIEDDERIVKYNTDTDQVKQFLAGGTMYSPVTDLACQSNYKEDEQGKQIVIQNESNSKYTELNAYVEAPIRDDVVPGYPTLREYCLAMQTAFGEEDETVAMRDALTVQRIIEETTTVEGQDKYKIVYMHLDQVDHTGHNYGYGKPAYQQAVHRIDDLIGKLYAAYENAGMLDDTLFVLCTDHGHRLPGGHKNHGKNTDLEVNITFAIAGKTVKAGMLTSRYVDTDMAAVISYALGVKASENWQARVPYGMFNLLG